MTKDELLQWVAEQGIELRDLPCAEWPILIERREGVADLVFLCVLVRVKDVEGHWVIEDGAIVSEERRIPIGTRGVLLRWMRAHGVDVEATPESGIRVVATDPPFLITHYVVRDGARRVLGVTGDEFLTTEREHRIHSMPQRVGVPA